MEDTETRKVAKVRDEPKGRIHQELTEAIISLSEEEVATLTHLLASSQI